LPVRSKGRVQTKRDTLVLQNGVGHEANNHILQKLFRNLTVEIGCRGGQGSPRAVAPTNREALSNIFSLCTQGHL
jgi:hypothetical protein